MQTDLDVFVKKVTYSAKTWLVNLAKFKTVLTVFFSIHLTIQVIIVINVKEATFLIPLYKCVHLVPKDVLVVLDLI